jgi:hypothetical protein
LTVFFEVFGGVVIIVPLEFVSDENLTVMTQTSNRCTVREMAHEDSRFKVWISFLSIDKILRSQFSKFWHNVFKSFDLNLPAFTTDLFDT